VTRFALPRVVVEEGLFLDGCPERDWHRRVLHVCDCRDKRADSALSRIVFNVSLVVLERHLCAGDSLDREQCRPHWLDAAESGHSSNGEGDDRKPRCGRGQFGAAGSGATTRDTQDGRKGEERAACHGLSLADQGRHRAILPPKPGLPHHHGTLGRGSLVVSRILRPTHSSVLGVQSAQLVRGCPWRYVRRWSRGSPRPCL
jgi:hypothetical protein